MKASLAVAIACALVLTGCEPARTASPIDPPDTRQVFDQAREAEGMLKGWARTDDAKTLKALVAANTQRSAVVFADPQAWPECGQVVALADRMLNSSTIYGITQAPSYHQRATALGCAIEDVAARAKREANDKDKADALVDRYAGALRATLTSHNVKANAQRVDLAARYLAFRSRQGQHACSAQAMKVAREQGKPFTAALAGVDKDCARPR